MKKIDNELLNQMQAQHEKEQQELNGLVNGMAAQVERVAQCNRCRILHEQSLRSISPASLNEESLRAIVAAMREKMVIVEALLDIMVAPSGSHQESDQNLSGEGDSLPEEPDWKNQLADIFETALKKWESEAALKKVHFFITDEKDEEAVA